MVPIALSPFAFSDKTSLGDQQATSTPNQLINNFFGTIRILKGDGYEIDPEDEEKMKGVIEKKGNEFKEWNRDALITSLKDKSLRKIKVEGSKLINEEIIFKNKIECYSFWLYRNNHQVYEQLY